MDKRIILFLIAGLAIYQYANKGSDGLVNSVSASSIDAACDAVVFTTATCPYCQQARALLDKEQVNWCEYDVNASQVNHALYQEHGGKGVPLAIIGNAKLRGFNKTKYQHAIDQISP